MKEKIRTWYKLGLWTREMVQQAVDKGVLTKKEMSEIVKEVSGK